MGCSDEGWALVADSAALHLQLLIEEHFCNIIMSPSIPIRGRFVEGTFGCNLIIIVNFSLFTIMQSNY